ncbi:MAG: hypothetical protein KAJ18_05405, partial [Candidatus Omnitrophica bacterium]|nr:hypothetical protein [Candidatus Omnitrophota bacterium]
SGLGGRFQLNAEDAHALRNANKKGLPFSVPIVDNTFELTYQGDKIYELNNIVKIDVTPNNLSKPTLLRIPTANIAIGPFEFKIKTTKKSIVGQTRPKDLPWFFKLTIDLNNKGNSGFDFKFNTNFATIQDTLEYTKFMKHLHERKELCLDWQGDDSKMINLNVQKTFKVEDWEINFFENFRIIEQHLNRNFSMPKKISDEDCEQAHIYARLISEGAYEVNVPSVTFEFLGKNIRKQSQSLLAENAELKGNLLYTGSICEEDIEYEQELVIEEANLDEESRKLICTDEIVPNKPYKLIFKSRNGRARLLYNPDII